MEIKVDTTKLATDLEKSAYECFEQVICKQAQESFKQDGDLAPMIFIGSSIGDNKIALFVMPVGEFMQCEQSKEKLSTLMHKVGSKMEPVCISMVTEAWMAHGDKDMIENGYKGSVKDMPGRIEVVICTFESENIQRQKVYEIIRGKELELKDISPSDDHEYSGKFVNMLKDMKKIKQN